jgi:RNA polymerase sigma-70 factor, ECF subfamily
MDETQLRPDDTVALARAAEGDPTALAVLHRRHAAVARRLAFRVLRDRDLAEDAVQEAFVDLWKTAAAFDPGRSSVRSWICVLTHRCAVDLARREARRRLADGRAAELDRESYSAEEAVMLRLKQRSVRVALEQLNDRHRELLELAYYGGLTQTQLAKRFDLPLGTVKSRTFEALRRLGALLGPGVTAVD